MGGFVRRSVVPVAGRVNPVQGRRILVEVGHAGIVKNVHRAAWIKDQKLVVVELNDVHVCAQFSLDHERGVGEREDAAVVSVGDRERIRNRRRCGVLRGRVADAKKRPRKDHDYH